MMGRERRQFRLALEDLVAGTMNWRIWYVLGLSEVRHRYRRSLLGPFWVTLSMAIQAMVMGFLLAFLFRIDVGRYLPFLCISLVTWTFLSISINEGANCFIQQGPTILQIKRPYWTYMLLVLWRNAIIYAHTVVIFAIAAVIFGIVPGPSYLLIPAGLVVLAVNAGWMALAAGILSARFRDVPLLIQNAFNVLLWLTPVFYHPDQLGGGVSRLLIDLNPLTYLMEVARAPFMNETPSLWAWSVSIALAVVGWAMTFALFARARARIAYWL